MKTINKLSAQLNNIEMHATGNYNMEYHANSIFENILFEVEDAKKLLEEEKDKIELHKINRDINGNPRYVVSFFSIASTYDKALELAKGIGGKKYNNKQFGGGIVFQSYNTQNLINNIKGIRETC